MLPLPPQPLRQARGSMANIAEIMSENSTVAAIDRFYESQRVQRRRLGLSQAGHHCGRYLWYKHHGYDEPEIDGRILRLFQLGNILEDQVVYDLRAAGFNVHSQQKPVKIEHFGITLTGSIDGIVEGLLESPKTPHLCECKTASKKKFDQLLKKKYRDWNPVYFWQVQFYMLGLGLKRAAVFVYCKDDSRLYMERIPLEKDATIDRLQDIFNSISKADPPSRHCEDAHCFDARFCPFLEVCFGS